MGTIQISNDFRFVRDKERPGRDYVFVTTRLPNRLVGSVHRITTSDTRASWEAYDLDHHLIGLFSTRKAAAAAIVEVTAS
jgi:hypothetical protein